MPPGSADLGDLCKVWEVKPLKKPGEDEARRILQRIANQVQPIMMKRKWRVKILSEFCPSNSRLLGLNQGGGVHVKLRLRHQNRDAEFFPYEQVLDTMLHELCHNERGPHDAIFYKLWDELRKECEELIAKGVTGSSVGFNAPGRRLGGFSHTPPLSSLRKVTLAAAEKRARIGALLPSGPKRLGGDSNIMNALSPVQAAAMAAERRLHDDLWCDVGSCDDSCDKENTAHDVGHSTLKRPFGWLNNSKASSPNTRKECSSTDGPPRSSTPLNLNLHQNESQTIWECDACTLMNKPLSLACEACGTIKGSDNKKRFKTWCCKFCTLENDSGLEKCAACLQWRYSHGAPVSAQLNLGT